MTEFFNPPQRPATPLRANFTLSPANPDAGFRVNFSGSAMGGIQPYKYMWSFGDGDGGMGQTIQHVYATVGSYTVSLRVIDAFGQTDTTSQAISVDTDANPVGTCRQCAHTAFPRTLGLTISFVTGMAMPLALSFLISRRHRRTTGAILAMAKISDRWSKSERMT